MDKEINKYMEAYYDNEANANKQMIFANAFAGCLLFIMWILYLTRVFPLYNDTFTLINIFFPLSIIILLSPLMYLKKSLKKPRLKYFVVFSFIFVIAILNVIIPKHAIIGWALCIVIVNHYYNPKLGKIAFIITLVLMLICLYLAVFVGEYDPNLLGGGQIIDGQIKYVYGIEERYNYLHEQLINGENRYLKIFGFYYVARAVLLSLIFFVSNALNKRTRNLLMTEIAINTEQAKTNTELEVAKQLQLSNLPSEFLISEKFAIQAELKPAKIVGGDFYDYYRLNDNEVAILIGDVSGKGIPAAMFMMKVITCFKNNIQNNDSPSQVLKKVNYELYKSNDTQMFATCFLAIVNTNNGQIKYANAGHNPPIIGNNKNYKYLNVNNGVMLGVVENANIIDEQTVINAGDTITLYTDGITEARNKNGEMYGENKLINLFNKKEYSSLIDLHCSLKNDIKTFIDDAEQSDDLTYLTLKFYGDKFLLDKKIFTTPKDDVEQMLKFVKDFSIKNKIDNQFINNLLVVCDELLSNIVKYGYKGSKGEIYLQLLFNKRDKELTLSIVDNGNQFNPFNVDNKPVKGEASNLKEGGLGILIVKKIMDSFTYDYINNKNIVTLKKKF